MKKIHYVNLGYGKCGTSWLYHMLIRYPGIDHEPDTSSRNRKEYKYLERVGYPFEGYVKYYEDSDISLGFSPDYWMLDSKQLLQLDTVATHYSVMIRNPYEAINSIHNFMKENSPLPSDMIKIRHFDYGFTIARMQRLLTKPIQIICYDDIQDNYKSVLENIISHLGLEYSNEYFESITNEKVNSTVYHKYLDFTADEIKILNDSIDRTSEYTGRDLSHWKIY
jgi:hypothetical protein